jgi:hypothetical protein
VKRLADNYPSPVANYNSSGVANCEDTYREVLSGALDHSVTIVAIGFTTCLRDLLMSAADRFNPHPGRDLVARKVAKVVFQGGWYAPLHVNGHTTFNWDCGACCGYQPDEGCAGAARYVVSHMPDSVQMIFSDVGDGIWHGAALTSCAHANNPCREAYLAYLGPGRARQSWDPIAVAVAVRGPEAMFGKLTDRVRVLDCFVRAV